MSAKVTESATTQALNLDFSDEDLLPALRRLSLENSNAAIFFTGQLTINAPEDVQIVSRANTLQTPAKAGSTLNFAYHPLEQALVQLDGQFTTGTFTLMASSITPRPR